MLGSASLLLMLQALPLQLHFGRLWSAAADGRGLSLGEAVDEEVCGGLWLWEQ
jgi:hypothetical protein